MNEDPSLIDSIRARPGLYFGEKSLTAFFHFLSGYKMACWSHRVVFNLGLEIPDDFHDWVAYRTCFKQSTAGWCRMIVTTSESEEHAFDRFFELMEEHAERVAHVVAAAPAAGLFLVTYTDDPGFFCVVKNDSGQLDNSRFFPNWDWFQSFEASNHKFEIYDRPRYESWAEQVDP
jgi:hypothetical protein